MLQRFFFHFQDSLLITRGSSSGLIYDFVLYAGKDTETVDPIANFSTMKNCVCTLCKSIPAGCRNVKSFMNNYFMTLDLVLHLKETFEIQTTETVQKLLARLPLEK